MKMNIQPNRNAFAMHLAVILGIAVLVTPVFSQDDPEPGRPDGNRRAALNDEELAAARMKARFRERRIIMNNDGNDNPVDPVTPESFLERRTTPLLDSHVDDDPNDLGVGQICNDAYQDKDGSNHQRSHLGTKEFQEVGEARSAFGNRLDGSEGHVP